VATLDALANRLRDELGDFGKSFVYQTTGDGATVRFLVPYSPIDGTSLIVHVNGIDVSTTVEVEEETGYVTFDTAPGSGEVIVFAGTYFRYFTNQEICQFVQDAFRQHTANHSDAFHRSYSLRTLPVLEEYPVVIYATTLAMYTLANDASFDIDITAPDGVMIPRSERYRQLMNMVQERKEQYKEMCSQLGIGLYKIDVFQLRRIAKYSNRYVPIYLPQEVDDTSMPQRVLLPFPTLGGQEIPTTVPTYDLEMYTGDSFIETLQFAFDVTQYTWASEIHMVFGDDVPLVSFTINFVEGNNNQLTLSLTNLQTTLLPELCFWDIRAKSITDPTYEQTYLRGAVYVSPRATLS
jgi:hypothetical protein